MTRMLTAATHIDDNDDEPSPPMPQQPLQNKSLDHRDPLVPPDEMGQLLVETNFTKREIIDFYRYATTDSNSETMSKKEFGQLCFEHGIKNASLVDRLWKVWDVNGDGKLSSFELVRGLNPFLRGDRKSVASFFFDLFDVDGDADLTSPEVIAVYSDLLNYNQGSASSGGLTAEQRNRLREWIHQHQNDHGRLEKKSFVDAVENMTKPQEKAPLWTWRTAYYVFLTAWFEMGTSFALPTMGALSDRIKLRFDTNDEGIGTLTSAYFFAAMVGPLVGGYMMDRYGPGLVVIGANCIVVIGAMLQAIANGPKKLWLVFIGRLLLGFGGEITPFTTIEILGRLFPDYFGFMAGVRNLVQSISGFLAFVLLPIWADAIEDDPTSDDYNKGTSLALWMCVVLGVISLISCIIVYWSMKREEQRNAGARMTTARGGTKSTTTSSLEQECDQVTISQAIRAFAMATTPKASHCRRWILPFSFYLACFGIKAQYFAPFGFTAFSNEIYREKFGQPTRVASFLSGYISLVAGLMSPLIGEWSDRTGKRSVGLAIGSALSMIGFGVLALSPGADEDGDGSNTRASVWIASTLFAFQYGFGDTVAYISIRFIVGVSRSGIGYGIYGVVGNLIATLVPIIGGVLVESGGGGGGGGDDNDDSIVGMDRVLWYFCGLMGMGTICWILVRLLEGPRSLLELPADQVIETSDEDLKLATLSYIASPVQKIRKSTDDTISAVVAGAKLTCGKVAATSSQDERQQGSQHHSDRDAVVGKKFSREKNDDDEGKLAEISFGAEASVGSDNDNDNDNDNDHSTDQS